MQNPNKHIAGSMPEPTLPELPQDIWQAHILPGVQQGQLDLVQRIAMVDKAHRVWVWSCVTHLDLHGVPERQLVPCILDGRLKSVTSVRLRMHPHSHEGALTYLKLVSLLDGGLVELDISLEQLDYLVAQPHQDQATPNTLLRICFKKNAQSLQEFRLAYTSGEKHLRIGTSILTDVLKLPNLRRLDLGGCKALNTWVAADVRVWLKGLAASCPLLEHLSLPRTSEPCGWADNRVGTLEDHVRAVVEREELVGPGKVGVNLRLEQRTILQWVVYVGSDAKDTKAAIDYLLSKGARTTGADYECYTAAIYPGNAMTFSLVMEHYRFAPHNVGITGARLFCGWPFQGTEKADKVLPFRLLELFFTTHLAAPPCGISFLHAILRSQHADYILEWLDQKPHMAYLLGASMPCHMNLWSHRWHYPLLCARSQANMWWLVAKGANFRCRDACDRYDGRGCSVLQHMDISCDGTSPCSRTLLQVCADHLFGRDDAPPPPWLLEEAFEVPWEKSQQVVVPWLLVRLERCSLHDREVAMMDILGFVPRVGWLNHIFRPNTDWPRNKDDAGLLAGLARRLLNRPHPTTGLTILTKALLLARPDADKELEYLAYLFEQGADPDVPTADGIIPLACITGPTSYMLRCFHLLRHTYGARIAGYPYDRHPKALSFKDGIRLRYESAPIERHQELEFLGAHALGMHYHFPAWPSLALATIDAEVAEEEDAMDDDDDDA